MKKSTQKFSKIALALAIALPILIAPFVNKAYAAPKPTIPAQSQAQYAPYKSDFEGNAQEVQASGTSTNGHYNINQTTIWQSPGYVYIWLLNGATKTDKPITTFTLYPNGPGTTGISAIEIIDLAPDAPGTSYLMVIPYTQKLSKDATMSWGGKAAHGFDESNVAVFTPADPTPPPPPTPSPTPAPTATPTPTPEITPTPTPEITPTPTPEITPAPTPEITPTPTPAEYDVSITKTADQASYTVGDDVTYTLTVTNLSDSDVTGVVVSDVIPSELTYTDCDNAGASYDASTKTLTVDIGTMVAGDTVDITVTCSATEAGTGISNTATVDMTKTDIDSTNNESTAEIDVETPPPTPTPPEYDVSITKTEDEGLYTVGDNVTYTLTVTNSSDTGVNNVVVTDVIPSELTYTSADVTLSYIGGYGKTYNMMNSTLTVTMSSMPKGATVTILVTCKATEVGTITNRARVTMAEISKDKDLTNNTGIADIIVEDVVPPPPTPTPTPTPEPYIPEETELPPTPTPAEYDVAITKTADQTSYTVGDIVTYTLKVTNLSDTNDTNVVVSDVIPFGLTYTGCDNAGASYDDTTKTLTVDIGTMAPNDEVTITVTCSAEEAGTITNRARVTMAEIGQDKDLTNNTGKVNIDVEVPVTPTPTPTPTPEITPTPTPEMTPEPSETFEPQNTELPTPTATPEITPTPTPTPDITKPPVTYAPLETATPTTTPKATPKPKPDKNAPKTGDFDLIATYITSSLAIGYMLLRKKKAVK